MEKSMDLGQCHLRIARPSDDLAALVKFYRDGLGLEILFEFSGHDAFDGVMLGSKGAAFHLEFTALETAANQPACDAPFERRQA